MHANRVSTRDNLGNVKIKLNRSRVVARPRSPALRRPSTSSFTMHAIQVGPVHLCLAITHLFLLQQQYWAVRDYLSPVRIQVLNLDSLATLISAP
jgi:hypothetical protein